MLTETIPYQDNGVDLEGFAAYAGEEKRPLAILCQAWRGRDEFICSKAKENRSEEACDRTGGGSGFLFRALINLA